jgi:simple sugar transport system permease protein
MAVTDEGAGASLGGNRLIEILAILPYAAPIALAALGETVSQKGGVINIGLEGMMLIGAFLALIGATAFGGAPIVGGLGLGVLGGMVTALFSGLFTVRLAADQVVVGTALNLLASGLTSTLFRAKYGKSGQLLSLPKLPNWHGFDFVIGLLLVAIPAVGWLLGRTAWGLSLRAAGEYERAAEASGGSVMRLRFQALAITGALAGLAGAYLVLGTTGSFVENMTSGRGFLAIALVTFGRWRPWLVCGAALLIGYLETLQFQFQASGTAVPYQFFIALPNLVALFVLVIAGKGAMAPGALGRPYRRTQ